MQVRCSIGDAGREKHSFGPLELLVRLSKLFMAKD
jgi:hypothetical protein